MEWELKIRATDIIMIIAIFAGPIVAVQITEFLRKVNDARGRKVHIFRILMATRSATLASPHVESLNAVDLEFHSKNIQDKRVLDACRLYMDHLRDHEYPKEMWGARRTELLVELLYEMSKALGYNFDKVQIKAGSYYPSGYEEFENDNLEIRKNWLNILKGNQQLHMKAEIFPSPVYSQPVKQDEEVVPEEEKA